MKISKVKRFNCSAVGKFSPLKPGHANESHGLCKRPCFRIRNNIELFFMICEYFLRAIAGKQSACREFPPGECCACRMCRTNDLIFIMTHFIDREIHVVASRVEDRCHCSCIGMKELLRKSCAIASNVGTAIRGRSSAKVMPFAVARPIRNPVKDPGPMETATASSCSGSQSPFRNI